MKSYYDLLQILESHQESENNQSSVLGSAEQPSKSFCESLREFLSYDAQFSEVKQKKLPKSAQKLLDHKFFLEFDKRADNLF